MILWNFINLMKILQLGKFYPLTGGVEKVMYDLMKGLSEMGVDCDMMCACADGGGHTCDTAERPCGADMLQNGLQTGFDYDFSFPALDSQEQMQ